MDDSNSFRTSSRRKISFPEFRFTCDYFAHSTNLEITMKKEYYSIVRGEYSLGKRGKFQWVDKTVEGWIVDTVFGIREEEINPATGRGPGWRITHIPTGFLLVKTYFETLEDATKFARITSNLYGDILQDDDPMIFKKVRTKDERFQQYYVMKEKLNNVTGTFSMDDIGKI